MLIDTRQAVRDLTEGGAFTKEQADKVVDIVSRADDKLATEEDIQLLRQEIQAVRWQVIVGTGTLVTAILAVFRFPL